MGKELERMKDEPVTVEVFENEIDFFLEQFKEEQGIEDLRTVPQSVWNGALRYICRYVFKPNNHALRSGNKYNIDNNTIPSNFNMYDHEIVNDILDYYIYLCQIYNKEISIVGFSNLTGIDTDTINEWGNNSSKLSSLSAVIYKKLSQMREESLSNKLADGKQNPVGVIAILNRQFGWASPYTSDANRQKSTLSASDLPKLGEKQAVFRQIAQSENKDENGENGGNP